MPPSRRCCSNAPRGCRGRSPTGRVSSTGGDGRAPARARRARAGMGGLGLLVVDGYVDLDPGGRPGLGAHAHEVLAIPVIGVAKSAFRTATHAIPVLRGASKHPLFVTSAGIPRADAAELVRLMAG